jgi:hypothetical protein
MRYYVSPVIKNAVNGIGKGFAFLYALYLKENKIE